MLNRTLGAWGWALFVLGMLVTLAWPVWWASADEGLPSPGWVEMNQPHGLLAEEDLPSDFGGVSIDAAKRWVDANIQDWNDDLVEIRSHRVLSCAVAQAELAMLPATGLAMSSLLFIDQLSGLLGTAPGARQAAAPLNASLGELLVRVKLTPVESELARRLMGREVRGTSDRIRLQIDTQFFLIRVSTRLFDEVIERQLLRVRGFWGLFRRHAKTCMAYRVREFKNQKLIEVSEKILSEYDLLERELDRE